MMRPFSSWLNKLLGNEPSSPKPSQLGGTLPPPRRVPSKLSTTLRKSGDSPYYDVVCPYCMERYPVWELEFRSFSVSEGYEPDAGYFRERDEKYVKFWEDMQQPVMNEEQNFVLHVDDMENVVAVQLWDSDEWIPLDSTEQRAAIQEKAIRGVKDKFGNASYQHICPECHNELPSIIGRFPNYIISMMGNTSCGKTVYMSRLLLGLINNELLPGRKMTVSIQSDGESLPIIRRRLENMFFLAVKGEAEPAAEENGGLAAATPIEYMKPTILDLQKENEHILLTLFDFPGEAIWRLKEGEQTFFHNLMMRTNANADGWLFLLDSTTLNAIRSCIEAKGDRAFLSQKNLDDAQQNACPSDVLRQFSQFFGNGKQISSPVSLVFSKSDMIDLYVEDLKGGGYEIDEKSSFLRNTPHTNRERVDLDDLWECDQDLQKFLGGDLVLQDAQNICPNRAWFASSATGAPVENGKIAKIAAARRVVEPLEWLLWRMGAYPGDYTQGRNPLWGIAAPHTNDKE